MLASRDVRRLEHRLDPPADTSAAEPATAEIPADTVDPTGVGEALAKP